MERKKKFADLKVGDTIWTTKKSYRRQGEDEVMLDESVVTKVGRLYLTVESKGQWKNPTQYAIDNGREKVDGNYATELVRSPEQWVEDRLCDRLWSSLTRQWRNMYHRPDGLTRQDIIDLGVKLDIDLYKQ